MVLVASWSLLLVIYAPGQLKDLETTASHLHVKNAARKLALWPGAKIVQRKVCVKKIVPRKKNFARVHKRNRRRKHFFTHVRITSRLERISDVFK